MQSYHKIRNLFFSVSITALMVTSANATPFINEIHYDNRGSDTGEFIEIAAESGFDLTGWMLTLYNGRNGNSYRNQSLSGLSFGNEFNGYQFATIDIAGIQNGAPDGIALINDSGAVQQFISYEGTFTANNGDAAGLDSADIGQRETSSTAIGDSLQLGDGGWQGPQAATKGTVNTGQTQFANGLDIGGQNGGGGDPDPDPEPDPATPAKIYDIQGAGHSSTMVDQNVVTTGIVTGVKLGGSAQGYYIQDPDGDGNSDTSDGIFVFTGTNAPGVNIGDAVEVTGTVSEFGFGSDLSATQISQTAVTTTATGQSLPDAIILGSSGYIVPDKIIDSDGMTVFNPAVDALDFYESLEGMRVTLPNAQVTENNNRFGEIYAVDKDTATGLNDRGGITNASDDPQPEKLQIDDSLFDGRTADVTLGDQLGDVTGIMGYGFGNFELLPTENITPTSGGLSPEVSLIMAADDQLTVASYNVENLTAGDDRMALFGQQVVNNLNSPDIIGLQEIQDNNGTGRDVLSASQTYQDMIDAIIAAGGPEYAVAALDPESINSTGGQSNGNIRNGFLYRVDRVDLKEGSLEFTPGYDTDTYIDPNGVEKLSFASSRPPLSATFIFNGEEINIVNVHFRSRGGSDPLFGSVQPPGTGKPEKRDAEAIFVNEYIQNILNDITDNVIVLGDMNAFWFEQAMALLADDDLFALSSLLDIEERYSTIYQGVAQALDHMLVSAALWAMNPIFDYVHVNSGFGDQFSDHDPLLASFRIARVSEPASIMIMMLGLAILLRRRLSLQGR